MTKLKPITTWKFDLQIVLLILLMFIFGCLAIFNFLFNLPDIRIQAFRVILNYSSTILGLVILGFQMILFRSFPVLKNLLITILILKIFLLMLGLIKIPTTNMNIYQIFAAIDGILDLVIFIMTVVFLSVVLGKKYSSIPLLRMYRTYAIINLCILIISFVFNTFFGFGALIYADILKLWSIVYLMYPVPAIFLILYYQKIKKIYPKLVDGTYEQPVENWPPPSAI